MKKLTILTIAACGLIAILAGCAPKLPVEDTAQVGQHQIVIIEPTEGAAHNFNSGKNYLQFNCGKNNIHFENEILTVNGKKYVIPNKTDSIKVKYGVVQINGETVKPIN
ncbi:MAG TPA: hypothetical protein QF753_12740 [Victivallales bacterium]|nr:hypothetical protein [Victivallales bacterium]